MPHRFTLSATQHMLVTCEITCCRGKITLASICRTIKIQSSSNNILSHDCIHSALFCALCSAGAKPSSCKMFLSLTPSLTSYLNCCMSHVPMSAGTAKLSVDVAQLLVGTQPYNGTLTICTPLTPSPLPGTCQHPPPSPVRQTPRHAHHVPRAHHPPAMWTSCMPISCHMHASPPPPPPCAHLLKRSTRSGETMCVLCTYTPISDTVVEQ